MEQRLTAFTMEEMLSTANKDGLFDFDKEVTLPQESFGECRNWKKCRNFDVYLGNGYCAECWDKGMDKRKRNNRDLQT